MMLKYYTLHTRQQEIRYQGHFESFVSCLESAVQEGVDCSYLNLRDRNLAQANLDGADFTGCDFTSANLLGTNMSECILRNISFANAVFSDVCLCETLIEDCLFFECSFSGTDIAGAILKNNLFSCPSFFGINIHEVAEIDKCRFYQDGEYCPINTQPIILCGLAKKLVLMDEHMILGHKIVSLKNWKKDPDIKSYKNIIMALIQSKSGIPTLAKDVACNSLVY
jgi:uncharacterized protein YjbI with pentapeptide repeats